MIYFKYIKEGNLFLTFCWPKSLFSALKYWSKTNNTTAYLMTRGVKKVFLQCLICLCRPQQWAQIIVVVQLFFCVQNIFYLSLINNFDRNNCLIALIFCCKITTLEISTTSIGLSQPWPRVVTATNVVFETINLLSDYLFVDPQ